MNRGTKEYLVGTINSAAIYGLCEPAELRGLLRELVDNDEMWQALPHVRAAFDRALPALCADLASSVAVDEMFAEHPRGEALPQ